MTHVLQNFWICVIGAKKRPKRPRAAVEQLLNILLFKNILFLWKYFLKLMSNSSFLTSNTSSLMPSTKNSVMLSATASKQGFTMASHSDMRSCHLFFNFQKSFVTDPLIGRAIGLTNCTTNQKRCLIWYLSTQLSETLCFTHARRRIIPEEK